MKLRLEWGKFNGSLTADFINNGKTEEIDMTDAQRRVIVDKIHVWMLNNLSNLNNIIQDLTQSCGNCLSYEENDEVYELDLTEKSPSPDERDEEYRREWDEKQ